VPAFRRSRPAAADDDPFEPSLCLHSPVLWDRLPLFPDRSASLDAHDPPALPCSRSRNVFVGCRVALPTPCPSCDVHRSLSLTLESPVDLGFTFVHPSVHVPRRSPRSTSTHLFSHTSIECRRLSAPASWMPRPAGPGTSRFRHLSAPSSRDVEHLSKLQHLSASDLSWCSLNTLTARVHIQRIVIEKVGSLVSDRTALLELSSLPTKPPGLRSPRLSSLPSPPRKISSVRLAALPFR
jgi:hypothetical protein